MATYEFYIYNTGALVYNSGTGNFDFSSSYTPDGGRYRVVVTDDDATGHVSGDVTQSAVVYDTSGNVVVSGALELPAYAELSGPGGYIYLDRFEVNGVHVGYASSKQLTPGSSYAITDTYSTDVAYSYLEGNSIPCFAQGTKIETDQGYLNVEDIVAGTRVCTLDHGPQEVLCHFVTPVSLLRLLLSPKLWPVSVPNGQNGGEDLWVSKDHRVLLREPLINLYFGYEDVLGPAEGYGRCRPSLSRWPSGIQYHHLLFERHQIIKANGLWVESFFPGKEAMQRLSKKDSERAKEALGDALFKMEAARPCLSLREMRSFMRLSGSRSANRHVLPHMRNIRVAGGM